MPEIDGLVDHLFRHRAGQMVSTLTRIFGPENLPLAEEVVQEALMSALTQWSFHGVPENPAGWLFRVARNKALDQLRRQTALQKKEPEIAAALSQVRIEDDSRDDTLSMMMMCCHPAIPEDARIALTLKTVGGFSVDEIAHAFLTQKSTIAQRLVRAKKLIRDESIAFEMPSRVESSLLKVIYLIFNEGYSAHEGDALVRSDLTDEAIRLASLLVEWKTGNPVCHALLSLMLLQAARLPARLDAGGEIAILAEQDRSLWDQSMIARGMRHLDASTSGNELTTYHIEAAIAACHAVAPSFEETDWSRIVSLYDTMLEISPSPVAELNRAVAIAMVDGPPAGIRAVDAIGGRDALRDYPLLYSTLGELWLRSGDRSRAAENFSRALELPSTLPEKRFLLRKLQSCGVSFRA